MRPGRIRVNGQQADPDDERGHKDRHRDHTKAEGDDESRERNACGESEEIDVFHGYSEVIPRKPRELRKSYITLLSCAQVTDP